MDKTYYTNHRCENCISYFKVKNEYGKEAVSLFTCPDCGVLAVRQIFKIPLDRYPLHLLNDNGNIRIDK